MLETPHVIVGAAIATKVGNPALAIPLAFLSHFVLDKIPHWNPHFYTETQKLGMPTKRSTLIAVADSLLALGTGLFFASRALPDLGKAGVIVACCLASVLSDQTKIPYFFLKKRTGFFKKWTELERSLQANAGPFWGILTQLGVIILGVWWLYS